MHIEARLASFAQLFTRCDRLHFIQTESVIFAPIEKLLYRPRICHPGITIPDGRGKKLDEAPGGALSMGEDRRRQRVHTSAHQRRGWRNLVAKNDRFLGHQPAPQTPTFYTA